MTKAATARTESSAPATITRLRPKVMTAAQQLAQWVRRGETEVFSVLATMTPDLATEILANNPNNRPLRMRSAGYRSVTSYAEAMKRGEWDLNGAAIIVAKTGELNDGQHRLQAVVMADVSVRVMLTFGVERGTRDTVDQSIGRSPGNILSMMGEKSTIALAAALRLLWCVDGNRPFGSQPTMHQLTDTLAANPDIRDSIRAVETLVKCFRLSGGAISTAHYLCRRHDAQAADDFLQSVTTGLNLSAADSPAARLRKRMIAHATKHGKMYAEEQAAIYVKAFNYNLTGRTGVIMWRKNGDAPEAFPAIGA